MAISEGEVRKSFARVKEDILQVKRSLNKQLFSIEGISKSLPNVLGKEEFYAFVERLGSKVEELEGAFAVKSDSEDVGELASDLRAEISTVRKLVERRDDLSDEVREARNLKGRLLELEGSAVSKSEFSKEAAKIRSEVSTIRSAEATTSSALASVSSSLSKLTKDLADLSSRLNSLNAKAVVKDDISSFTERMESSHNGVSRQFASLKRDVDKRVSLLDTAEERISALAEKLAAVENSVVNLNNTVSKRLVDRQTFEKSVSELRSKLDDAGRVLEDSMSEVNLDDYVTKRSLSQKFTGIEEQFKLLTGHLGSVRKSMEKQFGDELQKLATVKDLARLKGEIERLPSDFVPSYDFNAKVERFEEVAVRTADDFKKELKKQRELFEERLKSVESYYRSSNDSFKDELGELRSQIKGLSKADAEARTALSKISVSAAKAAAKSAADILKEVEEEKEPRNGEERRGKGMSPLALSLIIITVLVIGSVAFVMLKGPGNEAAAPAAPAAPGAALLNVTPVQPAPPAKVPVVPTVSEKPVTPTQKENKTIPQQNKTITLVNATVTANLSQLQAATANASNVSISNASGKFSHAARNQDCKRKLECTERSEGEYWFDCYFDESLQDCRCFVGAEAKCLSAAAKAESKGNVSNMTGALEKAKARSVGARYYGIVAFIVLVVAFFAYRALFSKEEGEEKKEEGAEKAWKAEKSREKPKAKEEKEPEKPAAGEDDDVIDLEEFFEKKENKKK
ncbi:hypothetical protein HYY73_01220 [Candidatus Woesearchaeota archaeon]|nr:hypothetical protein [Candidatus Woesearchaeota archaeon]